MLVSEVVHLLREYITVYVSGVRIQFNVPGLVQAQAEERKSSSEPRHTQEREKG